MITNINHPSVVEFILKVSKSIYETLDIKNYFTFSEERKYALNYASLKIIKNNIQKNINLSDEQIKYFIKAMLQRNEDRQDYEMCDVLKNILLSYNNLISIEVGEAAAIKKPRKPRIRKKTEE